MRIRMISPVMAPHYASDEVEVQCGEHKYRIPKGTALFLHGYAMGQDPELWDDPLVFNPDRWGTPEHKELELYGAKSRKSIDHYKFTPFSLGRRMCPGYGFAKVSTFMQAAALLQCFDWGLTEEGQKHTGGKLDLTENWGLTIMPKRFGAEGWIKATPRAHASTCSPQQGEQL